MDRIIFNIKKYADMSPIRFHMPGHGGKPFGSLLDGVLPLDVTELEYTDNLYTPAQNGYMDNVLCHLSELYGTAATVISAGGATLCLQSAIYCAKKRWGNTFLVDSRCHKSVFNALCLSDADVIFFDPTGEHTELLSKQPYTLILTSPDYYGRILDIDRITSKLHRDSHVIVDNSHGSHLFYTADRSLHPLCHDADLIVDSLHKTLPALTGAALLHSKCEIGRDELLFGMRLFGSTSPSYLISSSADTCCAYMEKHGPELLDGLCKRTVGFSQSLSDTCFTRKTYPIYDPFRITLCSNGEYDMSSVESYLHTKNIFSEFSDPCHLILIPSVFSSDSDFSALSAALHLYRQKEKAACHTTDIVRPNIFIPEIKPSKTLFASKRSTAVSECVGSIAGEIKYIYPPGIPYVIPGVRIDNEQQNLLKYLGISEITVIEE